jgi:peptidoglycan-N-acetylglucosamine deacetylase
MPVRYGTKKRIREIALTFDDGPNPKTTPVVLDVLAQHGIQAVFFVVGQNIATRAGRALMERAYREGHLIGNHSYTHRDLKTLSEQAVRDELRKTQDLIGECARDCKLIRPPYGSSNLKVSQLLQSEGYLPVLWNVDSLDWKLKTNAAWVAHAMEQIKVREDSVVLMHDIHATTVNNVGALISRIKRIPNAELVRYA